MSVSLTPVMTLAGLEAVLNAESTGVNARITEVGLGDFGWAPDGNATALRNERNRVSITGGSRIAPTQIHITAVENGEIDYWVREIGFYLEDGTLLAVWSDSTQALAWKSADVDLLLAFDMVLSSLPAESVDIVSTGELNLAPATETTEGVVRLANIDEARAGGINAAVVMNPAATRAFCDARYARVDHRHTWGSVLGKPSVFPPSEHTHTWASLSERPSTFPPSEHHHDERYARNEDFRVTTGMSRVTNRRSGVGYRGELDWDSNRVEIFPPSGFTMQHLQGFLASPGIIYFGGEVDGNDTLYCLWRREPDRIQVICANSENRDESIIHYLGIWRR